jgi:hypothetical protein
VAQADEQAAIVQGDVDVKLCVEVSCETSSGRYSLLDFTSFRVPSSHQVRQNIPVIAKLRPDVYGSPQPE